MPKNNAVKALKEFAEAKALLAGPTDEQLAMAKLVKAHVDELPKDNELGRIAKAEALAAEALENCRRLGYADGDPYTVQCKTRWKKYIERLMS